MTETPIGNNCTEATQDRDIPSVAKSYDFSRLGIAAFSLVGIIAIIAIAADSIHKNTQTPITSPESIVFRASSDHDAPYIQADTEHETPHKKSEADEVLKAELQRQALELARIREAQRVAQWQSPQLIFDAPVPPRTTKDTTIHASRQQSVSSSIKTSKAEMLQHQDSLVTQGTVIDGILETAVQSDLPGMVRAIISENVYSFDGSHLLIPRGSKLIGRYNAGTVRGQSRIFILWTRLLRHDGVSVNLSSPGTDDLGRTGLGGRVDTHFWERFGSSIMLSMVDTSLQVAANSFDNKNSPTVALQTGSDFSRSADIALENSVNIKPTIHIDQGTQIKVFVEQDLDFSQITGKANH